MRSYRRPVLAGLLLTITLMPSSVQAQQGKRFIDRLTLASGETVVVAEGDFEARSLGSYSIRIYSPNPEHPTDFFLSGLIRERDGSLERILSKDLDGDGREEVIVIIRSAGTGGYLAADALRFISGRISLLRSISGLDKHTDPVTALQKKTD